MSLALRAVFRYKWNEGGEATEKIREAREPIWLQSWNEFQVARRTMVENQIRRRGIVDEECITSYARRSAARIRPR